MSSQPYPHGDEEATPQHNPHGHARQDGQNKCPRCGSTEIATHTVTGMLRCLFCRHEFAPEHLIAATPEQLRHLSGLHISSGAHDIDADAQDVITLTCTSCGAQVVIDTASALQRRCHWCRATLSINSQVPNGAVPDGVLPFCVPQQEAQRIIARFVHSRRFFAHPTFQREFSPDNVMGVYFPYMVVDLNAHASFSGVGEVEAARYTSRSGQSEQTLYDADEYAVTRDFDMTVQGLQLESASAQRSSRDAERTNNVINAILPFDTQNMVRYDPNYLKGYTSEKRDTDVSGLRQLAAVQAEDIARARVQRTITGYNRGVRWKQVDVEVAGEQWIAAYLPVWLYSYLQIKGGKQILHYVAVNGRTKEVMGSIPMNTTRLWLITALLELLAILMILFMRFVAHADSPITWLMLLAGVAFFISVRSRYRNSDARHYFEGETRATMHDLRSGDQMLRRRERLQDRRIDGENTDAVRGGFGGRFSLGL